MGEESTNISDIFGFRASHFDILLLFIEVLKLSLKSRDQERISRREERALHIKHMENMVENFKAQGNAYKMANIGAGVMGILSGFCPILGHIGGGQWVANILSDQFPNVFANAHQEQIFKGIGQMTQAAAETQRGYGQMRESFSSSTRTFDQSMSDIHKTDGDENTRTMEEIKDFWKGIENFIYQSLQMYQDVIRQLYNG